MNFGEKENTRNTTNKTKTDSLNLQRRACERPRKKSVRIGIGIKKGVLLQSAKKISVSVTGPMSPYPYYQHQTTSQRFALTRPRFPFSSIYPRGCGNPYTPMSPISDRPPVSLYLPRLDENPRRPKNNPAKFQRRTIDGQLSLIAVLGHATVLNLCFSRMRSMCTHVRDFAHQLQPG